MKEWHDHALSWSGTLATIGLSTLNQGASLCVAVLTAIFTCMKIAELAVSWIAKTKDRPKKFIRKL